MRTPFKLKSGNASTFKNLGSSPAKHSVRRQVAATQTEGAKVIDVEHPHPKDYKEGSEKSILQRIKK